MEAKSVMDQDIMDQSVKESLGKHRESVKKYLESANAAATTYSYDCMVSLGGAGGGYLNVDFKKDGTRIAQFQGGFAGGVGGYTGWGTAWFNTPVEKLIGKSAPFALELVGVLGGTANVQIAGDGFIGDCTTGGVGIGAVVAAGEGSFKAA
jgi:hypothetical protein